VTVTPIFVDTGPFCALFVRSDPYRARAQVGFEIIDRQDFLPVTTNVVVVETYSLLLARSSREAAMAFLEWIVGQSSYRLERVTAMDEMNAQDLLRRRSDKSWSLCDALSFVVMKRLHIRKALSFDRHFREYGATIVAERTRKYGNATAPSPHVVEHEVFTNAFVEPAGPDGVEH
jgi:predicted nucleic acid-binding protein